MLQEVEIYIKKVERSTAKDEYFIVTRYYDDDNGIDYFKCPCCDNDNNVDIQYDHFEDGSKLLRYPLECPQCKTKYSILR